MTDADRLDWLEQHPVDLVRTKWHHDYGYIVHHWGREGTGKTIREAIDDLARQVGGDGVTIARTQEVGR
jgi:hypothetical protein